MAGLASLGRYVRFGAVVASGVVLAGAAAVSIAGPRSAAGAPAGASTFRSGALVWARPGASLGPVRAVDWWGGTYRGRDGMAIRVYVSDEYPVDETRARRWVDFLDGIPHERELADLTLYVAPEDYVAGMCGDGALGCYFYDDESIVVIGDDAELPEPLTVLQVLAHEYGHHVANNRSNAPWVAVMRGTKRWSSVMDVCACVRDGSLGDRYDRDPGEGFAETYRVLVDRPRGIPYIWPILDDVLAPNPTRLQAARLDVLQPWKPVTERHSARLPAPGRLGTWKVRAPWDGTLMATIRAAPGARVRVTVVDAATGLALARGVNRARTVLCGERALRVELRTISGAGRYTLTIVQP